MKIYKDNEVMNWTVDLGHSEIAFKVRHLMISHVKGAFKQFNAVITTSGKDFATASIALEIESDSIDTGDAKRDSHLRGRDFLSADKHKQITFTSTAILRTETRDRMELHGNLSLLGMTRNVKFDMQMGASAIDTWGNKTICFTVAGKITRQDLGLRWTTVMQAEGFLIGDELIIECRIELNSVGQHDVTPEPVIPFMRIA
jgi:polyisoprenoid-binding protein YceI